MTTVKSSALRAFPAFAPAGRILRIVAGTVVSAWTVMLNRRRLRALEDLDDYLLADMGLTRAELRSAFAAPYGEDPSLRLAAAVTKPGTAPRVRSRGLRGDAHAPSSFPGRTP